MSGSFYLSLFAPFISEQKDLCIEEIRRLVEQDAPKIRFSIVSGKLKMIREIEEQFKVWQNKRLKES